MQLSVCVLPESCSSCFCCYCFNQLKSVKSFCTFEFLSFIVVYKRFKLFSLSMNPLRMYILPEELLRKFGCGRHSLLFWKKDRYLLQNEPSRLIPLLPVNMYMCYVSTLLRGSSYSCAIVDGVCGLLLLLLCVHVTEERF